VDFQGTADIPTTRQEWVGILAEARPEVVARLAAQVEAMVNLEVTRSASQGLLLAMVEDSVEGNPFHPAEILASTCEVRLDGRLGYGICLGGDLARARNAAAVDAALQAGLPVHQEILEVLAEERRWLRAIRREEREIVQSTRVHFDTMEPQR